MTTMRVLIDPPFTPLRVPDGQQAVLIIDDQAYAVGAVQQPAELVGWSYMFDNAGTETLSPPTQVVAGDLLLLLVAAGTPPTEWTFLAGASNYSSVYWRTATGDQDDDVTGAGSFALLAFRGAKYLNGTPVVTLVGSQSDQSYYVDERTRKLAWVANDDVTIDGTTASVILMRYPSSYYNQTWELPSTITAPTPYPDTVTPATARTETGYGDFRLASRDAGPTVLEHDNDDHIWATWTYPNPVSGTMIGLTLLILVAADN